MDVLIVRKLWTSFPGLPIMFFNDWNHLYLRSSFQHCKKYPNPKMFGHLKCAKQHGLLHKAEMKLWIIKQLNIFWYNWFLAWIILEWESKNWMVSIIESHPGNRMSITFLNEDILLNCSLKCVWSATRESSVSWLVCHTSWCIFCFQGMHNCVLSLILRYIWYYFSCCYWTYYPCSLMSLFTCWIENGEVVDRRR